MDGVAVIVDTPSLRALKHLHRWINKLRVLGVKEEEMRDLEEIRKYLNNRYPIERAEILKEKEK